MLAIYDETSEHIEAKLGKLLLGKAKVFDFLSFKVFPGKEHSVRPRPTIRCTFVCDVIENEPHSTIWKVSQAANNAYA